MISDDLIKIAKFAQSILSTLGGIQLSDIITGIAPTDMLSHNLRLFGPEPSGQIENMESLNTELYSKVSSLYLFIVLCLVSLFVIQSLFTNKLKNQPLLSL